VLDQRHAVISALAQADGTHLRNAANRFSNTLLNRLDTSNECCADGTQTNQQDAKLSSWLGNLGTLLNRHLLSPQTKYSAHDSRVKAKSSRHILLNSGVVLLSCRISPGHSSS